MTTRQIVYTIIGIFFFLQAAGIGRVIDPRWLPYLGIPGTPEGIRFLEIYLIIALALLTFIFRSKKIPSEIKEEFIKPKATALVRSFIYFCYGLMLSSLATIIRAVIIDEIPFDSGEFSIWGTTIAYCIVSAIFLDKAGLFEKFGAWAAREEERMRASRIQ